jgi:alcohol dehydrogenase (cytochrome c)
MAVLGRTVFLGTLDGYLVALDANTGKVAWETRVADTAARYSITGAPLVAGNSVVIGVAGGDYGIRGFLAAFDPENGRQRWRFDTIPGPGQPGHETWLNDAWKTGGGATWTVGSYDSELDLLYWGVGNPAPDYNGDVRPGDNLFTNSVIALHASTGKLAWHFQFTPHDEHDWDSTQTPILTDLVIGGETRKALCWANRNGFYYVLDRTNGKFLRGVPFVELDWAEGLDANGRPVTGEGNHVSSFGRLTKPAYAGGTNWQNPALDQAKGLFFVHATEGASVFTKSSHVPPPNPEHGQFLGSNAYTPSPLKLVVRALDAATGERKWEYFSPPMRKDLPFSFSGLLATGGGLVFGASGGSVFAVESSTGRELWRAFLGGDTRAAPITFTVDGEQVVAVSVGRSLFVFGL